MAKDFCFDDTRQLECYHHIPVAPREVFRSERREAFSEFILPVNTPLLVKAVPPGGVF